MALSPRKSPDRAVSPAARNLRVSPRGAVPNLALDPRVLSLMDANAGESRARSFSTVEKDIKGYLQRKNPRAVTTQRWIKQWYSVSGDLLSFYNSKEDEESGKAPVGSLELEGAVLKKAKDEKAFQLTTPKKDLTLYASTDLELGFWVEGLNGIIGALKRRQAGLLEQHRDRQRLVELESRFEELLVVDLSDNAESALAAFAESRGAPNRDKDTPSPSLFLSPRSVTPLLSPRGAGKQGRPGLALSSPSLEDDDTSAIPPLQSPHATSGATPLPRLYFNWMFAHNRAVSWFAKLAKYEVQEVPLQHRRQFLAARSVEAPEMCSLPVLEFVSPAAEPTHKATSWTVSEAHAVLRYICNTHPPAAVWYPQPLSVRSRVDEYLDWHVAIFRRAIHGLWQLILSTLLRSADDTEQPMEKVRTLVSQALQTLNARLAVREFIATDEDPTIADLVAAAEVYTLAQMGWDMSGYGQITRWCETMQLLDHWTTTNREFVDFLAWLRGSNALSML